MKQELLERLTTLAKLRFSKDVEERLIKKLTAIIGYVEKLNELDTENVEPTSHAVQTSGSLREDIVLPSTLASDVINIAPERDGDFIQVPQVLES